MSIPATDTLLPVAAWRRSGLVLITLLLLLLALQWPLVFDLSQIWWHSKTFNHCLLIPAISAWLIYQRRAEWLPLTPQPSWAGVVLLLLANLLLLLGNLAAIGLIGHFALVLSVQALIWAVCGSTVCKQLLFPLLYLWFAVPFGEFLVPWLQDVTADMAVALLRLFDIPVFRDGHFIALPNGNFLVEEACSGISYLIASLALGTLYAYLQYRSYTRRAVFIALSIVVPIVANGIRAFGIILIAHLTNNEYAVGVDHLIYGWVFFGVVIFLLFLLGRTFADGGPIAADTTAVSRAIKPPHWLPSAAVAVVIVVMTAVLGQRSSIEGSKQLPTAVLPAAWQSTERDSLGAYLEHNRQQLVFQDGELEVVLGYFPVDRRGEELVNSNHRFYNSLRWRRLQTDDRTLFEQPLAGLRLSDGYSHTLVHRLYLFADRRYGAGWQAKWHQLQARLQQTPAPALLVLIKRPESLTDSELEARVEPLLQVLQQQLQQAGAAAP